MLPFQRRILAVLLGLLPGCAGTLTRPLPPAAWEEEASPAPRPELSYLVTVYQPLGWFTAHYGSGAIVHSCPLHGTYVLTAHHVVSENETVGVWAYGRALVNPRGREEDLLCFDATIVDPPPEDFGSGAMRSFARSMRNLAMALSRDFAVIRLETDELFHSAPLHPGGEGVLSPSTKVELGAVPPEGYPHSHAFEWGASGEDIIMQPGHSGAPVLLDGRVVAIVASRFRGSDIPLQRPTVTEMRAHLEEVGLGFVLGPRDGDTCLTASCDWSSILQLALVLQ